MQSVLQNNRECMLCGTPIGLHRHHCLHGTANRRKAEKYGYWVYLCASHHMQVHENDSLDRQFKTMAQRHFETNHGTRSDFIREFGKSYITEREEER